MGSVTNRTSFTSRARASLSTWNDPNYTYTVLQLNLGNNPLRKIEIVSALNSLNYGYHTYYYDYRYCYEKYNPKVYLGAVQGVAYQWNRDVQNGQTNGLPDLLGKAEKSGSWP